MGDLLDSTTINKFERYKLYPKARQGQSVYTKIQQWVKNVDIHLLLNIALIQGVSFWAFVIKTQQYAAYVRKGYTKTNSFRIGSVSG